MKKVCVVGAYGRMGSMLCDKLITKYEVIKIDKEDSIEKATDSDLVVDLSTAKQSVITARWCSRNNIPLIIGATGQKEYEYEEIKRAGLKTKIIMKSNFSCGISVLENFINNLNVDNLTDICVFEKHHKDKKDSPSGTAKDLVKLLQNKFNQKIQILSERGGSEIGTHRIDFYFGSELISISHQAFSRVAFIDGIINAIKELI